MLKRIALSDGQAFAAAAISVTKLVDPNQVTQGFVKLFGILVEPGDPAVDLEN